MKDERARSFTLTGKPALIVLLALAAIFVWRLSVTHPTVPLEVQERLRQELAAEEMRGLLPELQAHAAASNEAGMAEISRRISMAKQRISFASLKSRGSGDNYYVRAEILLDGQPPPSGKNVRYFQFHQSRLLGYTYQREAFAWEYYLPVFD